MGLFKTIAKSLETYSEQIDNSSSDICENAEIEVAETVDMSQRQSEKIGDSLGAVGKENYQESAKKQIDSHYNSIFGNLAKAIAKSLEICSEQIDNSSSDICEDAEIEVAETVDMSQRQSEKIGDSLGAVGEENYQESAKKQIDSPYNSIFRNFGKAIAKSLETYSEQIDNSLSGICENAEMEVAETVDMSQRQSEKIGDSLGAVDEENYQESAKKQMVKAYYILDALSVIDEILD